MSRFLDHASEIFEAASAAPEGYSAALTILIHSQGQIHIVDGEESPLDRLQAQHGGATAYRVTRGCGGVRVEGRAGSSRCVLEERLPVKGVSAQATALGLFRDLPVYSMAGALSLT